MSNTPASNRASYTYVDDPAGLHLLAVELERAPWHVLDTESNSGFAYQERLCLLQFNVGGRLWLVDLVALGGREHFDALRAPLESPERTTYLHGGEFDVGCLRRDYDAQLRGLWDSQQAALCLGYERTGYAAVVERVCGVELDKAHTQHDWARRPLPEEVLAYAVDDVRYLPEVCEAMRGEIVAADLEEELAIANQAVEEATWEGSFRPDGFWKIKGVGGLEPPSLPILVALWEWRDRVAQQEDRAPGRTVNNRLLLKLAANPPRNRGALRRLGLNRRIAVRSDELLALIAETRRNPPEVPPRPRLRRLEGLVGRTARAREDKLKAWRTKEAKRRGVPLQVVLPSRALEHLKRLGAGDLDAVPQLGSKRIRLYGDRLRELLE